MVGDTYPTASGKPGPRLCLRGGKKVIKLACDQSGVKRDLLTEMLETSHLD